MSASSTLNLWNPLRRFPLLRRGNRASFRFPSRSEGNLKEGGTEPKQLALMKQ